MNYFLDVMKNKYAQFEGRASRSEYWYFVLFYIIFAVVVGLLDGVMAGLTGGNAGGIGILSLIYILGTLVPSIAVGIRRLHDTGRSGWWYLIALIPIASLVLLAFFVMDSQESENKYGTNPKEARV
jgi:uncharacterized membrane protein YhaH (DUF805 family)